MKNVEQVSALAAAISRVWHFAGVDDVVRVDAFHIQEAEVLIRALNRLGFELSKTPPVNSGEG